MRQIVGWLVLVVGFFILGMFLHQVFSQKTQVLFPIPNKDQVRVIMLTPVLSPQKD